MKLTKQEDRKDLPPALAFAPQMKLDDGWCTYDSIAMAKDKDPAEREGRNPHSSSYQKKH